MDTEYYKMRPLNSLKYLITGSNIYGPKTNSSDIDLVLMETDSEELRDFLEKHKIAIFETDPGYEDNGFYFFLKNLVINIITCDSEKDFDWWIDRTEFMKTLPSIEDKKERLKLFQGEEEND